MFLVISAGIAFKLEKIGPTLIRLCLHPFHPYHPLQQIRPHETVSMPKYIPKQQNWTIIFEILWM